MRIHIVNFRVFEDASFEFSPGMNLVRGPNESGKSSLVGAIVTCLFEKPQAKNAALRQAFRWGAPAGPFIEMDFEHQGGRYRLVKDFAARTATLEDLDGGSRLESARAVEDKVHEVMGFADAAHYMRTACVTHDQMVGLAADSAGAKKLAVMLREVVVGGQESAVLEQAVKQLQASVDELKRGLERPATNPGTIRRLADERQALITRQKSLVDGTSEAETNRDRLAAIEGELAEAEPRLAELTALLEKDERLRELEKKLAGSRRRFETADNVKDGRSELERLDRRLEDEFAGFAELGDDAESELKKEIGVRLSLESIRDGLRGASEGAEEQKPGGAGRGRAGWLLVAAGLVLCALGGGLGALQPALFALLGLGVLVLAAGAYLVWKRSAGNGGPAADLLEDRLVRADDSITELGARERELLDSVGCKDPEQFFARYRAFRRLAAERDRAAARLEALMGDRSNVEAEEERKRASLETAGLETEIEQLQKFALGPEKASAFTREHATLDKRVANLAREKDNLTYHLSHASADPEEALAIEESVAWLWEHEQKARRRLKVYTIALEGMQQARAELLSSSVPLLAESVGDTFCRLTGGRYDTVEVAESDLGISVYSAEKGETIPADEILSTLSKGTVSQLYLAARLRLAELLSGGRTLPLIFDDSFSYFDDGRLALLWQTLLDSTDEQQVILLTCTNRYDGLLAPDVRLIELGRRA